MEASREDVATALISLGFQVDRKWKLKLRDEHTASALINTDGTIHDYGDGFHGDLIEVLKQYKNMSFKEAKKEAKKLLGQEASVDFTEFEKTQKKKKSTKALPEKFMIPHRIDAKNNRQNYLHELKQLFLGKYEEKEYLSAEWTKIQEVAKKYDIGFNKKSNRLIMPIKDINNGIQTFWKYKKRGADFITENGKRIKHRKVLFTKGRERPPFAIKDLKEFKEKHPHIPIIITEGEKDALVAMANGQHAICIGGAGASKRLDEKFLELFKGLPVIIAGDYDKAGSVFNENIAEQLSSICKSTTVLNWEAKSKRDGFKLHPKFDLADYFAWKNMPKKKKVTVRVEQISTVEIEIELNEGQSVGDLIPEKLFNNGKLIHVETRVLK